MDLQRLTDDITDGLLGIQRTERILAEAAGLQITESADSIALTRPGAPALPVPDDRVLRELFPYSPAERLIPHQLILPAGEISSLVVLFHGGGGDPSSCPADFRGMLPMYADRYHCAFLCPDAFIRNSTFGCRIPPQGILPEAMAMFPDTPEDKLGREASEDSILQLTARIREQYGLTEKPLYLAGNSMGGMGSFYLGAGHPDLVRAIAPAGAAPAVFAFDYAALKGMPVFFTAGELDHHGYGHLAAAADHMASLGLDLTFRSVPGGTHGGAWVEDPDSWLSFLVSHN